MIISVGNLGTNRYCDGCQSCSWSAEHGKYLFPCPCSRLRFCSRGTGSAVPSRVSPVRPISTGRPNLVLTHGIPPVFRDGGVYTILYRQPPSGQSRVYRVPQLTDDGVHCRESADTGPTVLKVARAMGAAYSDKTIDFFSTPLFSHTHY